MASPTFGSKSDLTATFTGTSVTIAVPSGVAADEMLLLFVYREVVADTISSTGFTLETSISTSAHKVSLLWKRATGADAGNYTIGLGSATNAWTNAACLRISGVITTGTPFDTGTGAIATGFSNSSLTTGPPVSLTTTVADTLLVYAGSAASGGAYAPPTGMTERTDTGDNLETATLAQASAAATGSLNYTNGFGGGQTSILAALLPATGGGSTFVRPTIVVSQAAVMRAGSW